MANARGRVAGILVIVCLGAVGCSGAPGDDPAENAGSTSEAYTSTGVNGCTLGAEIYPGTRNGVGQISCGSWRSFLQVEVCLQQYVGYWETIGSTCQKYGDSSFHYYVYTYTSQIPAWTGGRWYRTWVWGDVDGYTGTLVSQPFLG